MAGCASKVSRLQRTHEQQANFRHIWTEGTRKVQTPPAYTQSIRDMVKSWVRGKRAWFGGGEKEKFVLGFLLKFF